MISAFPKNIIKKIEKQNIYMHLAHRCLSVNCIVYDVYVWGARKSLIEWIVFQLIIWVKLQLTSTGTASCFKTNEKILLT